MSIPPPWPALKSAAPWLGQRLATRRGIWGKVQGASSDYRWIARSQGFGQGSPDLARGIRIGSEDLPVRASLWRRLADRHLAVSVYPSRARDSAGRPAVIEKQVLEWRTTGGIPACAAALALIQAIAAHDDSDWWLRQGDAPWHDPDHALIIPDTACPSPRLDATALDEWIATALAAIRTLVPPGALRAFYSDLLAADPPPAHLSVPDPLPPLGIAALLLPLPRGWAERVSIAGGIAGRRLEPADLADQWDAVATPHQPIHQPMHSDTGIEALAEAICEALTSADPSRLLDLYRRRERIQSPARPDPMGQADTRLEPPTPWSTNPRLFGLGPPPAGAPRIITLLHEFASLVDRRLLDLHALAAALRSDGMPPPEPGLARLLCAWPESVAAGRPDWVDREEWVIKCDQLRAAAWLLAPGPARLQDPGLPRDNAVPALLLAPICGPAGADGPLADLGQEAFEAGLTQSLSCPNDALVRQIIDWARAWCESASAPPWAQRTLSVLQPRSSD